MPSSSEIVNIWQQAVEHTRSRSPATFEQWFSGIQFDGLEEGVLELTARDEFVRDWVKAHFLPELLSQLDKLVGDAVSVKWRIATELDSPVCEARAKSTDAPPSRPRRLQIGSATAAAPRFFPAGPGPVQPLARGADGHAQPEAHVQEFRRRALERARLRRGHRLGGRRRPSLQPALHRGRHRVSARRT